MGSKSILFLSVFAFCILVRAEVMVCGSIAENDEGDMTVTSLTDSQTYVIGENDNMDDTPEVSEAEGVTVCFEGEFETLPAVEAVSGNTRTIAEAPQDITVLNVSNVWIPVVDQTGGGGGLKGLASLPRPDFL